MEKSDLELIQKYVSTDPELKRYWDEHEDYERKLEKFNRRLYLTPEEEVEKKRLQKLKLAGRDRIEMILSKYRPQKHGGESLKKTGAEIVFESLKQEGRRYGLWVARRGSPDSVRYAARNTPRRSATSWSAMSRERCTRPTAMPGLRARSASAS